MPTTHIDGVDLYYREAGSGPPLLLVHGTQPDADVWGDVFDRLATHRRVISYDRRGFSRSKHEPERDVRRHVTDAAALLIALGATPATVVGWSWGGIVALGLAAARPDLVHDLVLVEPVLHVKRHASLDLIATIITVQLMRHVLRHRENAAERFLRWANGYAGGGSALERYPAALRETIRSNARAILTEIDAGTGEDLSVSELATIRCPITCLRGDLSPTEFKQAIDRVAALLPQTVVRVVPRAGHAIHFDQPDAFVARVLEPHRQFSGSCSPLAIHRRGRARP